MDASNESWRQLLRDARRQRDLTHYEVLSIAQVRATYSHTALEYSVSNRDVCQRDSYMYTLKYMGNIWGTYGEHHAVGSRDNPNILHRCR